MQDGEAGGTALPGGRILCAGWWRPEQIACRVEAGQPAGAPPDLAARVEAAWQGHLRRHPRDYDGRILHPLSWQVSRERVELVLAPMRFAMLAARRSPDLPEAERRRIPGPLGLSTIPLAGDGRVLVARRSPGVSIAQGSLFFFGGFGEPPEGGGALDLCAEALRELREELGSGFAVREVGLLGIGERPAGHLNAVFLARLDAPSAAVLAQAGAAEDAYEWDRLWALEPAELMALSAAKAGAGQTSFAFDLGRLLLARHLGLPPPAIGPASDLP